MSTISANTSVVFNSDNSTYKVDGGSNISLPTWPITIVNNNPSTNTVTVTFNDGVTYSSNTNYFICGSDNIIFTSTGTVFINATSWTGLLRNGTAANSTPYRKITISGITLNTSGSPTIASQGGWLCQKYFSVNVNDGGQTSCTNIINRIDINSNNSGGIFGAYSFLNYGNTDRYNVTVSNSTNYGNITGSNCGGLFGYNINSGQILVTGSSNMGNIIGSNSGGFFGTGCGGGNIRLISCNNSSPISGAFCGGFFPAVNRVSILGNCYNSGVINGSQSGGFCAYGSSNVTIMGNCYNSGVINGGNSGGFVGSNSNSIFIYNGCYNTGVINSGGGFIGEYSSGNIYNNCINYGNINGSGGFIGEYSSGTIYNNCTNYGNINSGAGFIGSYSTSTIYNNCINNGIIYSGESGGFVGGNNNVIIAGNCINNGAVFATNSGGLTGSFCTVTIYGNCINNGIISLGGNQGGFVARSSKGNIYGGCINNGNVDSGNSGGFVGYYGLNINVYDNCINNGNINGGGGFFAPGTSNAKIYGNCINNGVINTQSGFSASNTSNIIITDCINNGNINGTSGFISNGCSNITLSNCLNRGNINSSGSGLVANSSSGTVTINKCCNAGNFTSSSATGFILASSSSATINISNSYNVSDLSASCVGFINGLQSTATAVVRNCYSTGNVLSSGFAFFNSLSANRATLINSYAFKGAIADSSTYTSSNVYAANGAWSDITANSILLNTPVDYTAGNVWLSISPNTPYYLSSSLISNLYSPNSETIPTISNYTTSPITVSNSSLANPFRIANVSYTGLSSYGVTIDPSNGALTFSGSLTTTDINYYVTCMSAFGVFPRNYNYLIGTYALRITGLPVVCFKEGSKILTNKGYVAVENLRRGDLIKTSMDGYVPLFMIGKREITHSAVEERIKDQLYKCSTDKYPELFEDLIITGCHSILIDTYSSEEERDKTIEVNGDTYVTDEKYRLPACADERASVYENVGEHTIYHFALENPDYFMNYGIYANGLLVETCSQRYLKELSMMELIE